ncbi:MAG: hypothetical protein SGBAC_012879 [Bacillariaceae sp.]
MESSTTPEETSSSNKKQQDPEHDSFFSALPDMARDSVTSEASDDIDEFILTEMCKEVAAMFGGTDYDSENFDDYDNYANKDRGSSSGGDSKPIKSSTMIDIVRKSLAGVQIDGMPAIDRFSLSLENPDEQRKLLEYFRKAKEEREKEARLKAEQQEAERIKRQEQDRKEREEREAKLKKEKEEKERKERHERERRERREKKRKEEKERKEREARHRAELEAAEQKAKAEREQREKERRELQAIEGEHTDMIEVEPGVSLPLLSKDATLRAMERNRTATATCFICQQRLVAPGHVDFIVCCDDWICMAVESSSSSSSSSKTSNSQKCIGFGLKTVK